MKKKFLRKILRIFGALVVIGIISYFFFSRFSKKTEAVWFDDNWAYRQIIALTNNTSTQTNIQMQVTVGTASLISAGKLQSNCADLRFTDTAGTLLTHWIEYCESSGTNNSSVWITIPSLPAGSSNIYMYYGNPSASITSVYSAVPSGINVGTGNDGSITVSSDTSINATSLISGRSCADGGDAVNYTVTSSVAAAATSVTLSSTPASGCLSAGDEVLIINQRGTTGSNSSVGKYETARIVSIATATLTLNRALTNAYDGTTQKIVVQRVPNYSSVTVNSAINFTPADWNGTKGGVMFFRTTGTVTATGNIHGNAKGYVGGTGGAAGAFGGINGESYDGTVGQGSDGGSNNESAGGGEDAAQSVASPTNGAVRGGGGGGGSDGATNTAGGGAGGAGGGYGGGGAGGGGNADSGGTGGAGGTAGNASDNTSQPGGGGGGGCNSTTTTAGAGGNSNSAGGTASCASGSGVGGEIGSGTTGGSGGGGAGGQAGSGAGGGGGGTYGTSTLTTIYQGSGGGGGGGGISPNPDVAGSTGGDGGGIVYVAATTITVTGTVASNGADGVAGTSAGAGGSGGGAGGSIYLMGGTVTLGTNLVSAKGGNNPAAGVQISGGGEGGVGRIYAVYSSSTGSASVPAATTATLPIAGSPATEEKATGPVAYWKFNEGVTTTTKDSTSNSNTGTLSGATTPSWQSDELCVSGKCLFYEGTTAYVAAGNGSSVQITGAFTISAWVNLITNSAVHDIVAKDGASGQFGYRLFTDASGKVNLEVSSNGTATTTVTGSTVLSTNKWYHVVGTYNPSTSLTVYVNGVQDGTNTTSIPASIQNSSANINIGSQNSGGSNFMKGFIDEVKVYNFVKTSAQITSDYRVGAGNQGSVHGASATLGGVNTDIVGPFASNLLGYWKMDESSGNATDSSGNSLTLTNNNTTPFNSGKFSNAPTFNGSNRYFSTATTISGVQTVSFWVYPASTTDNLINLASGKYISATSGTISATGFTSPVIYVNGEVSSTISASSWQFVTVTDSTAISGSAFEVGRANGSYAANNSQIDEVRLYSRAFSPVEVQQLYSWAPGPIGSWSFEEGTGSTAADSSGNGNSGTWSGTGSHWTTGKYGTAGNFNGSDDNVTVTSATNMHDWSGGSTESFWVYPKTKSGTFNVMGANGLCVTLFEESGTNFRVEFDCSFGTQTGGWISSYSIPENRWSHISITYNWSSTGNVPVIYVNGVPETMTQWQTPIGTSPSASNTFNIGRSALKGYLDEVKFYRYIRNQKQIVEDMNAGHPIGGSPIGTQAGYWKFDEGYSTTAYDSTPNANNCTLSGSPLPIWNLDGKFGKSIQFNGSTSYLTCGNNTSEKITGALSISAWIYLTNTSSTHAILTKRGAAGNISYNLDTNTSGQIHFVVSSDGTNTTAVNGATTLSTNTWYYVTGVYVPSTSMTVYVNGVKDGTNTTSIPASIFNSTQAVEIGSQNSGATNLMTGIIDEVKLYSSSLTQSEMLVDYNRGQSIRMGVLGTSTSNALVASDSASTSYCVPGDTTTCSAPVAEWNFEEGSGSTAQDVSGNGKTATINGLGTGSNRQMAKIGQGINFLGNAGSTMGMVTSSSYTPPTQVTIEMWFYPLGAPGNGVGRLFASFDGTSSGYFLTHDTSCYRFRSIFTTNGQWYTPSSTFVQRTWAHLAVTYDASSASNVPIIYMNGRAQSLDGSCSANVSAVGTWTNSAQQWEVGGGGSTVINNANGIVDQVRVFNYIRTPAQIAWDYNNGGPVAYYKFNECQGATAHDSSIAGSGAANGNDGTITIGASGTQTAVGTCATSGAWFNGVSGKNNYSLNFDGTDDYVSVTDPGTGSALDMSSSMSMSAWVYLSSDTAAVKNVIAKGAWNYYLDVEANETVQGSTNSTNNVTSTHSISVGSWHNVVFVFDDTNNTQTMYIDGIQDGITTGVTQTPTVNNTALYIGTYDTSSEFFPGKIDDVKIWNYPLTAKQVLTEYNQGSAVRFGPATGAP